MTSPYRGGHPREASPPGDEGIVDDLVRQFADPLAFYRELVQNAIDAGATSIEVEVRIEAPGELRISVIDDGEGMDADTVENALLVLFRSTKEGKSGKIGKFGVGFISVFAVEPTLVVVETKREGLTGLVLHLHPDHRYELFEDPALAARGTAVRLHVPWSEGDGERFAASSLEALRRWCRHANVPIRFRAWLDGPTEPAREERVDGPFELEALVHVAATSEDGTCRALVGLPADGKPRASFYNHGLTLYESAEPMLGPLVFKVQSGALGHTLSRDDVRRDAAFEGALRFVEELAAGPLVEAALDAMRGAADARNLERYGLIFDALARSGRPIETGRLPLFLAAPCGTSAQGTFDSLGRPRVTTVDGPSELAAALGARRVALVDARVAGGDAARREALDATLAKWLEDRFEPGLLARTTWIEPIEASAEDARLLDDVRRELERYRRRPSCVVLARVHGKAGAEPCCAGGPEDAPWLLFEQADDDPFRLLGRKPLVLNTGHSVVDAARRAAAGAPRVAAQLLVRTALLRYGKLSERRCAELGEDLLEALVTGGGT